MFQLFQAFLRKMKARLRSIARATHGEKSLEDLEQDAFVIAHEIGEKRGRPIDLSDPEDEELVVRALGAINGKWGDWKMRLSQRLDAGLVDDDGDLVCWSKDLPADDAANPEELLTRRELPSEVEEMLATSYSQATAYVLVFIHFGNDKEVIAAHLVISTGTLDCRLRIARHTVKVQHSLFDRVERVAEDFLPPPGKAYEVKEVRHLAGNQLEWDFGAD